MAARRMLAMKSWLLPCIALLASCIDYDQLIPSGLRQPRPLICCGRVPLKEAAECPAAKPWCLPSEGPSCRMGSCATQEQYETRDESVTTNQCIEQRLRGQGSDGSGPNIERAQQLYCPTPGRRRGEG